MNKINAKLTPKKLRLLLYVSFGLILIAGGAIFYFSYHKLGEVATETGEKVASAHDGENTLQRLKELKKDLENKQEAVSRASQVVANSQNYSYQDQIINDLSVYAARANLEINTLTFNSAQQDGAGASPTAPAAEATPVPAGLKTASVSVALKNPVNYKSVLNFLSYIEKNLTKFKVNSVTLTHGEGENVTTDTLNIEVYVR